MPQHRRREANRKRRRNLLSAPAQPHHDLDGPLSFLEPHDKRSWGRDEFRGRHARPVVEPILQGDISMDDVDFGKAIGKAAERHALNSHKPTKAWGMLYGLKGAVSFDILGQASYANAVRALLSLPKDISCRYTLIWYDENREIVKSNDYTLPAKDSECYKDPYSRALINTRKAMATLTAKYFLVKRCNEDAPERLHWADESTRNYIREYLDKIGKKHASEEEQQIGDKRRDVTKVSTGSDYVRRPIPQPLNAVLRVSDSLPEITKAVLTPTEQARLQQAYREVESIHLDRDLRCPIPRCTAVFSPLDEDGWLEHFREQHARNECPSCQDETFVPLLMDEFLVENEKPTEEEVEVEQVETAYPRASGSRLGAREPLKTNHDPAPRGKKRPRSSRISVTASGSGEDSPKSRQRREVIPGPHGRRRSRGNDGGTYVYTSDSDSADELQPDVDDLAPPKRRRVNDPTYKPSREGQNSEDELPAGSSVPNGARGVTQRTTPKKKVSFSVPFEAPDLSAEFTETEGFTEATAKKPTPKKSTPRKPTPRKQTPNKATPNRITPKKATVEDANSDEEDAHLVPEKVVPKDTASKTTEIPKATSGKEDTTKATPKKTTPTRNNAVEVTPGGRRVTRSAARAAAAESGDKL